MYTGVDPTSTGSVLRRKKDGTRASVPAPAACIEYNKYMGGVDRGDQLRGYHQGHFKSRKFYKYIVRFYFGVCVTNSFILLKMTHPQLKKMNIRSFREVLARQLIGEYCSRKRPGRSGGRLTKTLPLAHFPTKIPQEPCKKRRPRNQCVICKKKEVRSDTTWYCKECGVWLCHQGNASDCFIHWHRRIL